MSATATNYTYAIYIGQNFSFGEERIRPTYVMMLHMHLHEWDELENLSIYRKLKIERNLKLIRKENLIF
jgi:hypothetical protein